jgi:hypothetical protein
MEPQLKELSYEAASSLPTDKTLTMNYELGF